MAGPSRQRRRRVIIWFEGSAFDSAPTFRGIAQYAKPKGWDLSFVTGEAIDNYVIHGGFDGVIASLSRRRSALTMRRTGRPAVNLVADEYADLLPTVRPDDDAAGRLAADELLALGFRRIAWFGVEGAWSARRREALGERLAESDVHLWRASRGEPTWVELVEIGSTVVERFLDKLLAELRPPLALVVASDVLANSVVRALHHRGIPVPGDVALLGMDDSSIWAVDTSPVSLSSVKIDRADLGFAAAEMLDQRMSGRQVRSPRLVAPRGVAHRESTAVTAVDDPIVRRAYAMLSLRAAQGVSVKDIVNELGVPRSTLAWAYRRATGRTLAGDLRRKRLEIAADILQRGGSVTDAAFGSGFTQISHFSTAFRRATGVSPSRYAARGRE